MWWSHYCFFILLFLVSLWASRQTQIISSFRNLCSKHLPAGLCFEGNVAEKQILPEQRKEKTGPDSGPPRHQPSPQRLLWRVVGPLTSWLQSEALSEDPKRKGNRKCGSEWGGQLRQEDGAAAFPGLRGWDPQTPGVTGSLGVHVSVAASLLASVCGSFLLLFSFALFCLQFGQTIRDRYLSSVRPQRSYPRTFPFCIL